MISNAQAILSGSVVDEANNDPIPGAIIQIQGLQEITYTDINGEFSFQDLPVSLVNVTVETIGYNAKTQFEVQLTLVKPAIINFKLREATQKLEEVEVSAQMKFTRDAQSPVSVQSIGINEIQRNPGGNQDISKVIQSLPGVGGVGGAFRNDVHRPLGGRCLLTYGDFNGFRRKAYYAQNSY